MPLETICRDVKRDRPDLMRTFLTVLVLVILQWHVLLSTPKRNDLSETKEQPVAEALQRAQGRPGASRVRSEAAVQAAGQRPRALAARRGTPGRDSGKASQTT